MSDDLVKRIKDRGDWLVDAVATATQNRMFLRGEPECDDVACDAIRMNGEKAMSQIAKPLADRIEALTKERNEAWKRAAHAEKMWGKAEVKLAKAVESAEEMSAAFYSGGNVTERHLRACNAGVKLHAALAEIKGESHE